MIRIVLNDLVNYEFWNEIEKKTLHPYLTKKEFYAIVSHLHESIDDKNLVRQFDEENSIFNMN